MEANLKTLYSDFIKISPKKKVVIFQGSPRSEDSCAGQVSKSSKIVDFLEEYWSEMMDIKVVDLSVGEIKISPCKGCVSTSNGMHCQWKCTCYEKGMETPDLMYEADIYDLLEWCDAFLVVSPINWYSVSTQVKAMFDRLVCANLTLTKEKAIEILGKGNLKNAEITGRAELSGKYKRFLKNHLEGKVASFYVHGDDGANDYGGNPPYTGDELWDVRNSVMPLVYQCRYSGIDCPDDLVEAFYINHGIPYYQANIEMDSQKEFFQRANDLMERIYNKIRNK